MAAYLLKQIKKLNVLIFKLLFSDSSAISQASQTASTQPTSSTTGSAAAAAAAAAVGNQAPIRATEPMRRCSQILQTQRDCHPTVLVSLEGIAEQVSVSVIYILLPLFNTLNFQYFVCT